MDFCLRACLKDGLVFARRQVLEDEDVFEETWGYWRFRDRLVFDPTGVVQCTMLRLGCHLSPAEGPGHVQHAGWRARYRVLADGFLQVFDFSDLTPEEYGSTDLLLAEKERHLPRRGRRYIGRGSECQRLEAAKQLGEKVQLSPGLELRMEQPPTKKRRGLHHILPCIGPIGPLTSRQQFPEEYRKAISSWPQQVAPPETLHPKVEVPETCRPVASLANCADPSTPRSRLPGGAFGQFLKEKRAELVEECAGQAIDQACKLASSKFLALSEKELAEYHAKSEAAMAQHEEEKKAFIDSKSAALEVYNLAGKLVFSAERKLNRDNINLSALLRHCAREMKTPILSLCLLHGMTKMESDAQLYQAIEENDLVELTATASAVAEPSAFSDSEWHSEWNSDWNSEHEPFDMSDMSEPEFDVMSTHLGSRSCLGGPGEVCCYHMQGRCRFGDDCDFSHERDTGPCHFGSTCWYGHREGERHDHSKPIRSELFDMRDFFADPRDE